MIDTIHVRTMAIHSHVLTLVSKAPKISLKKRKVMSVVVACVVLRSSVAIALVVARLVL